MTTQDRLVHAVRAHTLLTEAKRLADLAHHEIVSIVGGQHASAQVTKEATQEIFKARAYANNLVDTIRKIP